MRFDLPAGLLARRRLGADWSAWLDALPARARAIGEEWDLTPDGDPRHGYCSLVVPVRTRSGAPAALKLSFDGDDEGAEEHLALGRWAGRGVVDLLRADPTRRALLLERLGPADLTDLWDVRACEIIGQRYAALHVPAGPTFTRLSQRLETWEPGLRQLLRGAPVPRRMVEHAVSLLGSFRQDEQADGTLIHFDLHYANVLSTPAAARCSDDPADWVVIDPKPLSGDPHAEVAPLLWNRFDELDGDVRGGLRRRFEAVVDAAMLEEDRARDWVILRMLLNISWTVQENGQQNDRGNDRSARPLTARDKEWITRCLSIAKAVQ